LKVLLIQLSWSQISLIDTQSPNRWFNIPWEKK
jgi:hypothetical protein